MINIFWMIFYGTTPNRRWWVVREYSSVSYYIWHAIQSYSQPSKAWDYHGGVSGPMTKGEAIMEADRLNRLHGLTSSKTGEKIK